MNYNLSTQHQKKISLWQTLKKMWPIIREEKRIMVFAFVALIINALLNLVAPLLIGHTIDTYVVGKDYRGVLFFSGIILSLYVLGLFASYLQTRLMGGVGQRVLYRLRGAIFTKLQSLPITFFHQNKAGDLISRINNDTDKINLFFSQSLVQFFSNIFLITGAVIFLLSLQFRLGVATLLPAVVLLVITLLLSPWVKKKNVRNAESLGSMSSEIQESLSNFKVIIAFNRRDYFKKRFQEVNEYNYSAALGAGVVNNTFIPIYGLASNIGQVIVLAYGIFLITEGQFTIGLLISFLTYSNNFYNPLRHLAALWASFQTALASWDRVHEILVLESDLPLLDEGTREKTEAVLAFEGVHFGYPGGKEILHNICLSLEQGKTYALVGPTGGGKTTTASLMARLYDPTMGRVLLQGKDIRSYTQEECAQRIGFILQEPFLFTGTVRENIVYGHEVYGEYTTEALQEVFTSVGLEKLVQRFSHGLDTVLTATGEGVSLGQKQLIAFMRAVLRKPDILILDEATANIDTVTEQLLEDTLRQLPATTTKVIIAHRLNTIADADEIFFVNGGTVTPAGSMEQALEMLLHHHRQS